MSSACRLIQHNYLTRQFVVGLTECLYKRVIAESGKHKKTRENMKDIEPIQNQLLSDMDTETTDE